jgi:hypothetical protein
MILAEPSTKSLKAAKGGRKPKRSASARTSVSPNPGWHSMHIAPTIAIARKKNFLMTLNINLE